MSSIIKGYEYDIFISYRQKDNRHDGWVTEFVNNLKGELEATFKEDISVYFDINSHDGLLETHDVDASLKDKLKCLVFIPIISRTYCDPKSFAWEHEFKAFVAQASLDQYGLKVKLSNGNVANRMIPVQIHDLYTEDKIHIEKEIGGILRAIEFIYKEPGVNRPLIPKDNEEKNSNKTNYRNQINKVANAIDEVIHSLKEAQTSASGKTFSYDKPLPDGQKENRSEKLPGTTLFNQKSNKLLILLMSVLLCVLGVNAFFRILKNSQRAPDLIKLEKSIAVLPFVNDSPDEENTFFINGIMEEILGNLQKIKDFRVLSRTSTDQYRATSRPSIPEIAKKLGVNYLVEGSGQKYGNTFRLRVKLVDAVADKELWAEFYEQEIHETKEIFNIQSRIAQAIAEKLMAEITPEEKQLIEKTPTMSLTAYDFYRKGFEELMKYGPDRINKQSVKKAESLFHNALEYDSTCALAYTGLANAYWKEYHLEDSTHYYLDSMLIMAEIALSYDTKLAEAYFVKGGYYYEKGDANRALTEWDKAIMFNPNSWHAYWGKGFLYNYLLDDQLQSIRNIQKAASLNHGSELTTFLTGIGLGYYKAGFPEKGKYFIIEALKLDGDSVKYIDNLAYAAEIQGDYQKAIEYREKKYLTDSTDTENLNKLGYCYLLVGKSGESLKYYKRYISRSAVSGPSDLFSPLHIGFSYWQNGNRNKAEYFFAKQTEFSNYYIKFSSKWWHTDRAYLALAGMYAFRGDKRSACENLKIWEKQKSNFEWLTTIKNDPLFNNIRNEPEFQHIVNDLEAKYKAEHELAKKWLEEERKL